MIKSVNKTPLYDLLSPDNKVVYDIPPYQREYSWGKEQWDALFYDLLQEEAGDSHFMGTIICVNKTIDTTSHSVLELVDGQQRMTTLSLLLLALFKELTGVNSELDDEQRAEVVNLKKMIALSKPTRQRLQLQQQNSNADDYVYLLNEAGFDLEKPKVTYVGVRRIAKSLNHFTKRIDEFVTGRGDRSELLLNLVERVKSALLVKLEVESHSDAFVLFESLNNRGLPLTPIDLIKTSLLGVADKNKTLSVELAYQAWTRWLDSLGGEYGPQERFFRQFYNAFKTEWDLAVPGVPVAYRSKLIRVYDELLKGDLGQFITRMDVATTAYGRIIGNIGPEDKAALDAALLDLNRAQGSPAHMLLLYVIVNQQKLNLSEEDLSEITELLTRFFVRRNLTNTPPTYDLDRLFISTIERISNAKSGDVLVEIEKSLTEVSASDESFKSQLLGSIYFDNAAVARFILVALAKQSATKEWAVDFWEQSGQPDSKQQYVWTIEHILPQGENLPESWVTMLGGKPEAVAAQREYAHKLGNLTITGYNATLGNKSFQEKKDRTDQKGLFVGYRNGLALNADLIPKDSWTVADIEERTNRLAASVLALFKLGG